jgi:uncharacterized protein (TIGR00162 family)
MSVLSMSKRPSQSVIQIFKEPKLEKPILVSGLPGIGFVGSIAAVHIIRKLNAEKFGEVYSPYFQDSVYASLGGSMRRPTIELHACRPPNSHQDLIILYGNTQPLTSYGQYEVSKKIIDKVRALGCKVIVTLAGLRQEYVRQQPQVFCVASGFEIMDKILPTGVNPLQSEVYGMAGLLVGLARLNEMQGICLLAETLGIYPDPSAAKAVLEKLSVIYGFQLDLSDLTEAAKEVS